MFRDRKGETLAVVRLGRSLAELLSPTEAGRQVGLGRATVYREMALAGIMRTA